MLSSRRFLEETTAFFLAQFLAQIQNDFSTMKVKKLTGWHEGDESCLSFVFSYASCLSL